MTQKARSSYRCAECGASSPKWTGQCADCGAWNTLAEELDARPQRSGALRGLPAAATARPARLRDVAGAESPRLATGMPELDFVLGGGIVPGSMILIGGEPGIGKSTLLLQAAAQLLERGCESLYVSGEESPAQIKLRAERILEPAHDIAVLGETSLEAILAAAQSSAPAVLIVDSIQTIYTEELEGAAGNVGQVRECAARLMRYAKEHSTAVVVVGHVTRGGGIAGPKMLEHIVDTVLYFEGESHLDHRVLRATKNRFGGVDEIGVFRMTQSGLEGVENPSALFMGSSEPSAPGTAVAALMEGTRPMLVEIQALATKSGYGTPQRVTTGFDARRLAMLLAVLEKRAGLPFGQLDVFVNVAGGLRITEPAGDLAVAAALASSLRDRALPHRSVFIGEIGLGGEIRPVSQTERRIAEARRLGMTNIYASARAQGANGKHSGPNGARQVHELLHEILK